MDFDTNFLYDPEFLRENTNDLDRGAMVRFAVRMNKDYQINWHHRYICEQLDKFIAGTIKRLMVFLPPQEGKLLPSDTPILTTKGWKPHGELQAGDYVFGQDGKPKKVIANSGIYDWNVDKINFQCGESILAAKEHLWKLKIEYDDHKGRINWTGETQNIFHKRFRRSPYIEVNKPLEIKEQTLPIDPYLLGAWLGDGLSRQGVIISGKQDIGHFSKLGNPREVKGGYYRILVNGLTTKLHASNLLKNKHIPIEYILSSKEQRISLLQGLMDTDGTCTKVGRCEFTQMDSNLGRDVYTLLRTLGYKPSINYYDAKLNGKSVGIKIRIFFNPNKDDKVFSLKRKSDIIINKQRGDRNDKYKFFIKDIQPYGIVKGNCIEVKGGMYLAGTGLIPTHNSELTSRLLPAYILGKNPNAKVIIGSYSADIAEGFNRDIQRYMESPDYIELFPATGLQKAGANGSYVRNTKRFDVVGKKGFLKAVGVEGSITGTPGDYAIIDDPHKDMAEGQSPTMQEAVWNWYSTAMRSRLHNKSGILLIQTRWDTNDLAGKLLKLMEDGNGETWNVICFPAIKENNDNPDDPRKIGEALWPERHDLNFFKPIITQDPRGWQHVYQQNPKPVQSGGECYKSFAYNTNVKICEYDDMLPLNISFDFNVNPYMSCSIWQIPKREDGLNIHFTARQIAEITTISPHNTTVGICKAIRAKFPDHNAGMFIYGDPNGRKEDTRTEKGFNDYTIILRELEMYNPKLRVLDKAPAVKQRIDFMNVLFAGGYNNLDIEIGDKCYRSIEDFQYIKEMEDGTKQKVKYLDPATKIVSERWGHLSDTSEYFICKAFYSHYSKFLSRGKVSNIVLGKRISRHNA